MPNDWPTWTIILGFWICMTIGNELGYHYGLRHSAKESELSRSVSETLKAGILGLVALLLGFSFSATVSRYDLRNRLMLDQANAVGTCYLRAELLDPEARAAIQTTL